MSQYYISAEGGQDEEHTTIRIMRSVGKVGKSGYANTDNDETVATEVVLRAAAVATLARFRNRVDMLNRHAA